VGKELNNGRHKPKKCAPEAPPCSQGDKHLQPQRDMAEVGPANHPYIVYWLMMTNQRQPNVSGSSTFLARLQIEIIASAGLFK